MTQPAWLIAYSAGVEGAEDWVVLEETQHFALIKIPGRHYYGGRCRTHQPYALQEHWIVRKAARYDRDSEKLRIQGSGRLNKERRAQASFSLKWQEWDNQ